MGILEAIILGVVEGLTEYLPVSSTGHLVLAQRAMGIESSDAANAYAICIQLGAIVAVLALYFGRVKQMAAGVIGRDDSGRALVVNIVAAFIPAAILGLTFESWIEERLFGLWPIVAAWFVGGVLILVVHWLGKEKFPPEGLDLEHLVICRALGIGLIQCLAMWPGVSRSLVTIVGGVVVGLSLPAAVEFSFLLGVITLGAATCYKALQLGGTMLAEYGAASLIAGAMAATVSATFAVKWMVAYLNRHGLSIFGYYRVGLAVVVGGLLIAGIL